jgi:UDP-N-acetylmuramoyl-tripeptide--D-alanyl-D-alanine ligase
MISIPDLYSKYLECTSVSTDTRKISEGSMFFALKGPNFNANEFALQALEKGAQYSVSDDARFKGNDNILLVDDVLQAMQHLSTFHRQKTGVKVFAITGSNGKTTTKELCYAVIKNKFRSYATHGNLNNHIGVPLTILSMPRDTEFLILEMGANHRGEIAFLCETGQPDFGLITNIGKAHLEGFGGPEGVKIGKSELYKYLIKNEKIIFLCKDNKLLNELAGDYKNIIYYGTDENNFCTGKIINESPTLSLSWKVDDQHLQINTKLTGAYNFENVLAAVTIGKYFNVDADTIKLSIEGYIPENKRSEILKGENNIVIADYYNANPSSMEAAIKNFATMEAEAKVAILGDMLELGSDTDFEHRHILEMLQNYNIKKSILIGPYFNSLKNHEYLFFSSTDEAIKWIEKNRIRNSLILLKGSRGIQLEKLLPLLI